MVHIKFLVSPIKRGETEVTIECIKCHEVDTERYVNSAGGNIVEYIHICNGENH